MFEKGRQLKSFDTNTYTYNANGIRTSKTINGITHTYTLDGTKILKEVWENNVLIPLYDNEDTVCGIEYNGSAYWFYKNLQGDVIAITDSNGDVIAKYTYDAWGKLEKVIDIDGNAITDSTNIATINPYRYRSYYFDNEIGLYYLQSRYYDPAVGRFINADDGMFTSTATISHLFCYCMNEPVSCSDEEGRLSSFLVSIEKLIRTIAKNPKGAFATLALSICMYLYSLITIPRGSTRDFTKGNSYYGIGLLMMKRLYNSALVNERLISYAKKHRYGCNIKESVDFEWAYNKYNDASDLDLFLSVGNANDFTIKMYRLGVRYSNRKFTTQYKVSIFLSDYYNFDEFGKDKKAYIRLINNYLGYYPMKYRIVKTYWWKIQCVFL